MNFDLGPDELALRDSIRGLCRKRFPMSEIREWPKRGDTFEWRTLGEAGVFAVRAPEVKGGLGLGMAQAVVVFEELGRALVPGPLVATELATQVWDAAVIGGVIPTITDASMPPIVIPNLSEAYDLLVITDDAIRSLDVRSFPFATTGQQLDPQTTVLIIDALPEKGIVVGTAEDAARWRIEGATLTAALLSGIASHCVDAAVAYAKEREQFGRVIGSFQAVKHLCADMLVRAEVARAAVDAAGCVIDDPSTGDRAKAAATAKILAGEAALANAKSAIQVFGGMGFTWEVDLHLYLKRAAVLATQFGSADMHAEAVAACL